MSWQKSPLGMVADTQLGKMLDAKKNEGEYHLYLGNDNVQWDGIDLSEVKEMRFKDSELSKFALRSGDLLVCEGGDPGRCAIWSSDDEMYYQKALHRVRAHKDVLDNRFLYYFLVHIGSTHEIRQYYTGGATIKHLPKAALERVIVRYPDLEAQRRIAGVLSAYDEFIENNRKQIKLLEEAAQRLYKEWFVDLKFPGHETTPIANGLPEGWKRMAIKEICERIQSGSTPSRKHVGFWEKGKYRWFKTAELQDCYLFDSEEHISEEALSYTAVKLYPANTVLMAIYASPTLGRLGILTEASTFNQAALALVPSESYISVEWLYLKLWELRDEFNQIARGAGQQNISGEIVKNYAIAIPAKDVVSAFTSRISPFFKSIRNAQHKINAAREARDRLLPKLMSGEIGVV